MVCGFPTALPLPLDGIVVDDRSTTGRLMRSMVGQFGVAELTMSAGLGVLRRLGGISGTGDGADAWHWRMTQARAN